METKICIQCKEEKSVEEFNFKFKDKGVRIGRCKSCYSKNRKKYYNGKKAYQKVKKRRDRIQQWFKEYKKTLKCEICGENHPATIDFHHKDRDQKSGEMRKLVNRFSIERLKEEISKCRVLCSNCHRKLHWNENHNVDVV